MKQILAALAAAIAFLGAACAPVETGPDQLRPVIGGACSITSTAEVPNAACGFRCLNSRFACVNGFWDCLAPPTGAVCIPIPADAAVAPSDAVVSDAPRVDVPRSDAAITTDAGLPAADTGPQVLGSPCTNGVGGCSRPGVWARTAPDGGAVYCATAEVGRPDPRGEVCDRAGIDEDCDGMVNEVCDCTPGETRSCYGGPAGTAGRGICAAGRYTCGTDGRWSTTCVGEVRPTTEVCVDGRDNNCDGITDEAACLSMVPDAGSSPR